jgi:hypothetical protein
MVKSSDDEPAKIQQRVGRIKGFAKAFGTEDSKLQNHRMHSLVTLLKFSEGDDSVTQNLIAVSATQAFIYMAPKDDIERMLVTQMIGTHEAATECLRRAMIQGQGFESRDVNLKHAEKLMAVYTKQIEALNKHRGKGHKKSPLNMLTLNPVGRQLLEMLKPENRHRSQRRLYLRSSSPMRCP